MLVCGLEHIKTYKLDWSTPLPRNSDDHEGCALETEKAPG